MLAKGCSVAVTGIDAYSVEVNAGWGDTRAVMIVNKTQATVFLIV